MSSTITKQNTSIKVYLFSTIILILLAGQVFGREWELVKPKASKKVTLLIADKERVYQVLDIKHTSEVVVFGPGLLKVLTRPVMSNEDERVYSVLIERDHGKKYDLARVTKATKTVRNIAEPDLIIGHDREFRFAVPPGKHVYSLKLPADTDGDIYARYLYSRDKSEDIDYIAYLPRVFSEEVSISIREKEYLYYRGSESKPVEIEVIGPTRIKAIVRLEFDYTMRGLRPYRVQVFEGEELILTQPLEAHISSTAVYVKPAAEVLGAGDTFYIDVPKGKHRYIVKVPDPGHSVIFRFYLPASDLHNTIDTGSSDRADYFRFFTGNPSG